MAEFTKKTGANGNVQYRNATENKIVSKDSLSELLLAKLENVPEGTKVPENADLDVPDEAPEVEEGVKTAKITLPYPLCVNGKTYPGGKEIEVPADQADDLVRIANEHADYERNLIRQRSFDGNGQQRPQDISL